MHERKKGREQENKKPPKTCASGAVIRRIVCNRTAVAMQARRQAGSAVLSFVRSFARSRWFDASMLHEQKMKKKKKGQKEEINIKVASITSQQQRAVVGCIMCRRCCSRLDDATLIFQHKRRRRTAKYSSSAASTVLFRLDLLLLLLLLYTFCNNPAASSYFVLRRAKTNARGNVVVNSDNKTMQQPSVTRLASLFVHVCLFIYLVALSYSFFSYLNSFSPSSRTFLSIRASLHLFCCLSGE